jgi:23S rRNA (pseudouridine1915-N3)-methyltransferase
MHIHLLAVGQRMPGWINAGLEDYVRRLPPEWGFVLKEIPASKRRSVNIDQGKEDEGSRLLAALPRDGYVIALHERGKSWTSEELAEQICEWMQSGRDIAFVIGGPDGLVPACIEQAEQLWSLSRLTLPHALVRVIVVEQLYRASTLIRGHPYHR